MEVVHHREEVDARIARAREGGVEIQGPHVSGPSAGYWVFLKNPDGHTLKLAYGQEVALAVKNPNL